MTSPRCTQCHRPAIVEMGGHPLCVEHAEAFSQILQRQNNELANQYNHLLEIAEATTGVYGVMPRMPVSRPTPVVHTGPHVTYNNFNVTHSSIGVINTGSLTQLDRAIGTLRSSSGTNSDQLADAISRLTEKIVETHELQANDKDALISALGVLSTQASSPQETRLSTGLLRSIWEGAKAIADRAPSLLTLWDRISSLAQILAIVG